jgi:hypothetical protein
MCEPIERLLVLGTGAQKEPLPLGIFMVPVVIV